MNRKIQRIGFFILAAALLISAAGYSADEPLQQKGNRTLNVTVADIKGDMLFYRTDEGTVRNVALKLVEKYEKVGRVKVGDPLVMEFDEGNQLIKVSRPGESSDNFTVSGQVLGVDSAANKVTLKLEDGTTKVYSMIPPAGLKMAAVPKGTTVVLNIDAKNNLVKDFERKD
jgi:hypothetical protein